MRRIDTGRGIAGVHHDGPGWNVAVGQHVGHAMRVRVLLLTVERAADADHPVAALIRCRLPQPAAIDLLVFGVEPCYKSPAHLTPRQANVRLPAFNCGTIQQENGRGIIGRCAFCHINHVAKVARVSSLCQLGGGFWGKCLNWHADHLGDTQRLAQTAVFLAAPQLRRLRAIHAEKLGQILIAHLAGGGKLRDALECRLASRSRHDEGIMWDGLAPVNSFLCRFSTVPNRHHFGHENAKIAPL